MPKFSYYELVGIPNRYFSVHEHLVKNIRFQFSIFYDFSTMKTFWIVPFGYNEYFESLVNGVIGLEFKKVEPCHYEFSNAWCIVGFPSEKESLIDDPFARDRVPERTERKSLLVNFFNSFDKKDCRLLISFIPAGMKELDYEREVHEHELSRKQDVTMQQGSSYSDVLFGSRSNVYSKTRVDYANTDRTQIASEIVTMCNNAKNLNDSVFRVSIIGFGESSLFLKEQLKARLLHIDEKIEYGDYLKDCHPQKFPKGEIMSGRYASKLVHFSSKCAEEKVVVEIMPLATTSLNQGERIGRELTFGVGLGKEVYFDFRALNRHALITGLQGAGKSTLAMLLCRQVLEQGVPIIVITPNKEWSRLGRFSKEFIVFRVGEMPMNAVRCPDKVRVDIYRQELATLLSNSVDAGPYTEPLQRVLLNAFRELYESKREPNLEEVYSVARAAIENSFGMQLKNGTVKFDKYGHNLTSSLEYLRELKQNENFSSNGLRIEDCVANGVVFDISSVPKLLRPLCYSLLLSQIFTYASAVFDEEGDGKLRLLLVLEEAQLVFKKHAYDSGSRRVIEDVENELGSFRKRGIGLAAITHFPDQLSQWIWRHMQNHFVLKQDVKGAKIAVEQLAFDISNYQVVAHAQAKLLKLNQGEVCCLLTDAQRRTVGPFFMQVEPLTLEPLDNDEIESRVRKYLKTLDIKKFDSSEYYAVKEDEGFLKDVHAFPFSALTNRYRRLEMYTNKGKEVKDKLVRLGFLEELAITIGKGNYSYLVMTEKGSRFLALLGVDNVGFWQGKNVSFEHRLYQHIIHNFYVSSGYDAVVEQPIGDERFTDVAVYSKDRERKIAVEVTLQMGSLVENVVKNVNAGFDSVLVVVRNLRNQEKAKELLEKHLTGEVMGKVSYVLIEEFGKAVE